MRNQIKIDLDNRFEYVNEYDDDKISDQLHDYINEYSIELNQDVVIVVNFNYKISLEESKKVVQLLKKDFEDTLEELYEEVRHLNIRDVILFFIGFCLLVLSGFCGNFLISEFFSIISWVTFWEVAESFLFVRHRIRKDKRKYYKLLNSEIIVKVNE